MQDPSLQKGVTAVNITSVNIQTRHWFKVLNEIPAVYNTVTFMSLTTFVSLRFSTEIVVLLLEPIHAQRLMRTYCCSTRSQTPSLCRLVLNCLLRF